MKVRVLNQFFGASLLIVSTTLGASAAQVNMFGGSSSWDTNNAVNGTAEIVDLTGQGGNLENNAPAGTGAVRLTTTGDPDKAEAGTSGNFGTVGDFINAGSLSYDYFKDSAVNGNASAAAAIKLTIFDTTDVNGDGFGTFIFEPTWNLIGPGVPTTVPTDQWLTAAIDGTNGSFWHTGLYGFDNQFGDGSDGNSLQDWLGIFGDTLLDATIIGISVGIGTFNDDVVTYFDNVAFSNGGINKMYDFEVAPIPVPAALPLLLSGLGLLGFLGLRRKARL